MFTGMSDVSGFIDRAAHSPLLYVEIDFGTQKEYEHTYIKP